MTARQQRRLWRHVETIENFWETLTEIEPGAVARLAAVATERKWEVLFLTKRPASAGATSQMQTQRWLEAKGFALPSVYVVQGSRGRIAAALGLDFVVDDRPENCLDIVVDSKARAGTRVARRRKAAAHRGPTSGNWGREVSRGVSGHPHAGSRAPVRKDGGGGSRDAAPRIVETQPGVRPTCSHPGHRTPTASHGGPGA